MSKEEEVALIAAPTRADFTLLLWGAGATAGTYFVANGLVTTFILPYTDHILLAAVLALLTAFALFLLREALRRAYEWTDHNEWFRGMAALTLFLMTLAVMVVFQLIQAFITSEFWAVTPEGRVSLFAVFLLVVFLLLEVLWRQALVVFLKGIPAATAGRGQ